MTCDICKSKKVIFEDEFQKLCKDCWRNEVNKEYENLGDLLF